jgi:hypothetical protein
VNVFQVNFVFPLTFILLRKTCIINVIKHICKYCVHMFVNGKNIPVETIPGIGERG